MFCFIFFSLYFFRNPSGCKSSDDTGDFSRCDCSVHRILLPKVPQYEKHGSTDQGQTGAKRRDFVYHCW